MSNKLLTILVAISLVVGFGGWFAGDKIVLPLDETNKIVGSLPGPVISSPYLSVNGVHSEYVSGTCANATTTLFSVNPFWGIASSTVTFHSLNFSDIGASTTNMSISVATSTTATTSLTAAYVDQQGYAPLTSTAGTATTSSLINAVEINATSTLFAGVTNGAGGFDVDSRSKATIGVGKFQKVIGYVEPLSNGTTNVLGEATGNNNTFDCNYE